MQGAGNDFVVIDNRSQNFSKEQLIDLAPKICDRKFGVGSDGILALMPAEKNDADYTMFYRNPDGSDAGMCGNGARCIARFAYSLGFEDYHSFIVHDSIYTAEVDNSGSVTISFPMEASVNELAMDSRTLYQVHTGTEHIGLIVNKEKLEDEDSLREEGQNLRYHDRFQPKGTNVNFIWGMNPQKLKLQTYERGVEDLTLACGTGAIASALIWHHRQDNPKQTDTFRVETKGGSLNVYFSFDPDAKKYSNIKLEGPAQFVFKGEYIL